MCVHQHRESYVCKRPVYGYKVCRMDAIHDRHVLVNAASLDDVLELTRRMVERLPHEDPMAIAARGALGQLRADMILEPRLED